MLSPICQYFIVINESDIFLYLFDFRDLVCTQHGHSGRYDFPRHRAWNFRLRVQNMRRVFFTANRDRNHSNLRGITFYPGTFSPNLRISRRSVWPYQDALRLSHVVFKWLAGHTTWQSREWVTQSDP